MGIKVAKFGGSSLADAAQFRKVEAIVKADADRRYVVVSAPGKRSKDDIKVTDLLYQCFYERQQDKSVKEILQLISERYIKIVEELGLSLNITDLLKDFQDKVEAGASLDYIASRGEFFNGVILASLLSYSFIDPTNMIIFNGDGTYNDQMTQLKIGQTLKQYERAVIPGFYGSTETGEVKIFSRGGSDITGAIVAQGAEAAVYENWTDVSGFLMADPGIVENPKQIKEISYKELRELSYMGAKVLHEETIFPVLKAGIPINIRNTNEPDNPGTMIVSKVNGGRTKGGITGIAGVKDFTVIAIEKYLMNYEVGYVRRMLSVLEKYNVSFEHLPSGIDNVSVIISNVELDGKLEKLVEEITQECQPDSIMVYREMCLIATVGHGMAYTPGMAARLFGALAEANINVRMIDQGSSEINIIVGVENKDFEEAVRAIYHTFVE